MKIAGIIAEYNPFHNGHAHHMKKTFEVTGADGIIVIMSGNFVQRGSPAIIDKYIRTRAALAAGADVVLELPVRSATGSAEHFADGAISVMNGLCCVSDIVFGCETQDLRALKSMALFLENEPERFKRTLRQNLKDGLSFPYARALALEGYFPEYVQMTAQSNNILALEYMRALIRHDCKITPHAITRIGKGHNDTASGIRRAVFSDDSGNLNELSGFVSDYMMTALAHPLCADDFSPIILPLVRRLTAQELSCHLDVSPQLATSIKKAWSPGLTFTDYARAIKSRNYTLSHINRALLHIMLGLKKNRDEKTAPRGVRLLGLRKKSPVPHILSKKSQIPIITKVASDKEGVLKNEIFATDIYRMAFFQKFGRIPKDEYRTGPVIF